MKSVCCLSLSRQLLDALTAISGVLSAGIYYDDRTTENIWKGDKKFAKDGVWSSLWDTFQVLKLHKLPDTACEWHLERHVLIGVKKPSGVVGVVCEKDKFRSILPRLKSVLDCEALSFGEDSLVVGK